MVSPKQVTVLLEEWSHGNEHALDELVPLVEVELHRLARQYMSRERAGHTLQTTALVNEAYLRLAQVHDVRWENRAHFFAIAARIMRRIMIEHARKRQQLKRGGGAVRITLDEGAIIADERSAELLALDEALVTHCQVPAQGGSRRTEIFRWANGRGSGGGAQVGRAHCEARLGIRSGLAAPTDQWRRG